MIHSIVIGSKKLEDDMLNKQGYTMLGHILKKVPPKLLTPKFVQTLNERYAQISGNKLLQEAFFWDFAMDFTLWTYTPSETQHELICTFTANPRVSIRHLLTIIQIFYWNESHHALKPVALCKEGPRPNDKELSTLRGSIFEILRKRVKSGVLFSAADGDAVVNFLLTLDDNVILSESLAAIIDILESEDINSVYVNAFAETLLDKGVLGCLLNILNKSDPDVCLLGVRIIFCLMFTLKTCHRFSIDAVLVSITQRLLANPTNIELTPDLYSVMQKVISKQHIGVLCACILPLIPRASVSVRMSFMKDLSLFIRCDECAIALLDYPGWYALLCNALKAPSLPGNSGETISHGDVVDLAGLIGSHLVICAMLTPRLGWASVEPLFAAFRASAHDNELIQDCELKIFECVADSITILTTDQEKSTIPKQQQEPISDSPSSMMSSSYPNFSAHITQTKTVIKKQGIAPFVTPLLYIIDFFFVYVTSQIKFYGSMASNVLLQLYASLNPKEVKYVKAERIILPLILKSIENLCYPKPPTNWGSAKTSPLVKFRSGGLASLSATLALRIVQLITIDKKAVSEESDTSKNFIKSISCINKVAEDQTIALSSLSITSPKSSDFFFFIVNSLISSYKISVCTYPGEICNTLCNTIFSLLSRFSLKPKEEKKVLARANDIEREIYKLTSLVDKSPSTLSSVIANQEWIPVKKKLMMKALPYFMAFEEDSNKTRSAFEAVTQVVLTQLGDPIPPAIVEYGNTATRSDQIITVNIPTESEIIFRIAAEKERLFIFRQDTIDASFVGSVNNSFILIILLPFLLI